MTDAFRNPNVIREAYSLGPRPYLWQVYCPVCGEEGADRAYYGGGDHEAITIQPDRDDYESPIGTRGGYIRVELVCPAGHEYALVIANHKGAELLGVVPSGSDEARQGPHAPGA